MFTTCPKKLVFLGGFLVAINSSLLLGEMGSQSSRSWWSVGFITWIFRGFWGHFPYNHHHLRWPTGGLVVIICPDGGDPWPTEPTWDDPSCQISMIRNVHGSTENTWNPFTHEPWKTAWFKNGILMRAYYKNYNLGCLPPGPSGDNPILNT